MPKNILKSTSRMLTLYALLLNTYISNYGFFFHLFRLELNPMRVLCMFELYVHLFSTYFPTCVYCVTSRFIFRLKVDSTAGETTKYFFPFLFRKAGECIGDMGTRLHFKAILLINLKLRQMNNSLIIFK